MEFKGTKGEWEVSGLINQNGSKNETIILTENGAYVPNSVQKAFSNPQELEANAKLISAAPDLLKELIELRKWVMSLEDWKGCDPPIESKSKAIQKALGDE